MSLYKITVEDTNDNEMTVHADKKNPDEISLDKILIGEVPVG
jgi:hypothetical protein